MKNARRPPIPGVVSTPSEPANAWASAGGPGLRSRCLCEALACPMLR